MIPTLRTPSITVDDRTMYFTEIDGSWWIAVKPICEALGLKYDHYRERLREDPILAQLPRNYGVVAADGKVRKMLCLPERYIYGWIFQLPSKSEALLRFKRKCYDLLYDHFHGPQNDRRHAINEKAKAIAEQRRLRKELEAHPAYRRMMELEGVILNKSKLLKEQDRVIEVEQLRLFDMDSVLE